MKSFPALQKLTGFFLVKIIIGLAVVGVTAVLAELLRNMLLAVETLPVVAVNVAITTLGACMAILSYIILFLYYEKRKITELSAASFLKYATIGILTGLLIQTLSVVTMLAAGSYHINHYNPLPFLMPGFLAALTAGVVVELMIRGIIFRITEQKIGTFLAMITTALIFTFAHLTVSGATVLLVITTTIQAGFLLTAVYVYSRSLWLPIFFHFAWDLAEPGIFGAINPGIKVETTLFSSSVTGPTPLTGGSFGPGNSIQAAIFCLIATIMFLQMAKKRGHFIKPEWKRTLPVY
jgi:uncharacterized protein